jgi:hypothetical protein
MLPQNIDLFKVRVNKINISHCKYKEYQGGVKNGTKLNQVGKRQKKEKK